MKIKTILITIVLFNPLLTLAVPLCSNYITDEWPSSRYLPQTLNAQDFVVTDKKTQLMWKRCAEGKIPPLCLSNVTGTMNWSDALSAANDTNTTGGYAGFSDWRLPNIEELKSLVARNCVTPSIYENVFSSTILNYHWSSSPSQAEALGGFKESAWAVNFNLGQSDYTRDRTELLNVRLVRSVN